MAEIKTIYKGESVTLLFTFPEAYDMARLASHKVFVGETEFAGVKDGQTIKLQLKSSDTDHMIGAHKVVLWIDDAVLGLRKPYCSDLVVAKTQASGSNASVSNISDIIIPVVISETAITVGDILYNYVKGDKGDPFLYSDFTPEQIAELQQPATEAIASIQEVELAVEQAEGLRQQAELNRQTNTATAIQNAETAKTGANNAASLANEKAGLANNAATLANEKAGLANTATTQANAARDGANNAAQSATNLVNSYATDLAAKELKANKQNSLVVDGTGTKFPTVDAVNEIRLLLPNNQIAGEGTQSPTVVTIINGYNLTITAVANDVVFPNQYAYKRRYLATSSTGFVYTNWSVNYPTTKPSIIAFAYWVKDSDIDAVYTGKGNQQNFWLYDTGTATIHMLAFDNVAIKASIGTTVTGTFNYTGKMSGKWEVTCIDKQNGYSRIAINWYDIVYDPSYTKTNFKLYHTFNGVMPEFNGKTIDFVGFTLVFNEKIVYPSVYPDSAGKLQYPETLLSVNNRVTTLDVRITNVETAIDAVEAEVDAFILSQSGSTTVVKSGNALFVRTPFDSTRDLVQSFIAYGEYNFSNSNVSYGNVYLIDKTKGNTVADLTTNTLAHLLKAEDDRTPIYYNGTYIGGGHGCSSARLITVNSHGKASVDIGSEWVDGSGRKYYILRIVNLNQLWVISENIGTGDVWQFDNSISGTTLTHSANATNTATMTIAANELAQLLPAIKNNSKKVYLDGKTEVTTDGVYFCSFCDIVEQYDIVNPASMLLNLIAAVGTAYTDTTLNTAFKNGAASVFNQILYRIQSNGALQIVYGWRNYQQINLGYMGFMQADTPPTTTYPKLKLYMPKILPISDGVKTWDFRNIEAYDVSANSLPGVTNIYWENPLSPPERAVEFLCDSSGNNKVGFAIGYDLTKGIGKVRKDVVSDAWFFYTSRKLYPRGIDNKLNPLLANNWYSCVGYRILFNAENPDMGSASTFYHYELGNEVIVVFDYHTQVSFDNLQLPAKYVGMSVTVVEKSSNIIIHTEEVMQNGITVSVGAGNYGYCVLKLS